MNHCEPFKKAQAWQNSAQALPRIASACQEQHCARSGFSQTTSAGLSHTMSKGICTSGYQNLFYLWKLNARKTLQEHWQSKWWPALSNGKDYVTNMHIADMPFRYLKQPCQLEITPTFHVKWQKFAEVYVKCDFEKLSSPNWVFNNKLSHAVKMLLLWA